jgi:hypothetical protein
VALAAGAIVALAATDEEDGAAAGESSQPITTATGPPITIDTLTGETTLTIPPPTTTLQTTTGLTTTTQPTTSTQATTTTPSGIISWPANTDGWTVIIKSTPTSQGRGPADAAAREAISNGLTQVGVLSSSDFSSLNPDYYVTFTGVYTTKQQAQSAVPNARSKGFPTAYDRKVAD